jgi:hypothetical protein
MLDNQDYRHTLGILILVAFPRQQWLYERPLIVALAVLFAFVNVIQSLLVFFLFFFIGEVYCFQIISMVSIIPEYRSNTVITYDSEYAYHQ